MSGDQRPNGAPTNGNGDRPRDINFTINAVQQEMEKLGVTRSEVKMARVMDPGDMAFKRLTVVTNAFGIKLQPDCDIPLFRYDVNIYAQIGEKHVEFTKKSKADYLITSRSQKCQKIFDLAIKRFSSHVPENIYFYDLQSILFSLKKLELKSDKGEEVRLSGEEAVGSTGIDSVFVSIKPVTENFQTLLGDVKRVSATLDNDHTPSQFVDIVTNMSMINQPDRFVIFPKGKIYPTKPEQEGFQRKNLGGGKYLNTGIKKGVRVIEGPKGRGSSAPALIVDSVKAAFHEKQLLVRKVFEIIRKTPSNAPLADAEMHKINEQIGLLGVETIYLDQPMKLEVMHLVKECAATKRLEFKMAGTVKTCTVAEYFFEKHKKQLEFDKLPLVAIRQRGQINLYPIELLMVIPHQRVTIPQTSGDMSTNMTGECTVDPIVRQTDIQKSMKATGLADPGNTFLREAGIEIIQKPLEVGARVMQPPTLVYGGRSGTAPVNPDANSGKWRTGNTLFKIPAKVGPWGIYAVVTDDKFTENHLRSFAEAFVSMALSKGMQIGAPGDMGVLNTRRVKNVEEEVRNLMRRIARDGCTFAFFVTADFITIHKMVKLEERMTGLLTQDLKLKTCMNYLNKKQNITLENIVNKTNVKHGGLNYSISVNHLTGGYDAFAADRLFLGVSVSHPPPGSVSFDSKGVKGEAPSVVGWAANTGKDASEIIGDFRAVENHQQEVLPDITFIVNSVMERYGRIPKDLIIYRNGVSEGAFALAIRHEVPLIRGILQRFNAGATRLTYIAVQKDHNIRLFKKEINPTDRPAGQNIPPGTVVDSQLTHPLYKEFFLNSHSAGIGTAITPRYTVLVDDANYSLNEIELVTHALTFNFQIVSSAISTPAPLYIADRYATRGRDLVKARVEDEMASSDSSRTADIAKLNEKLPYGATPLGNARINA